MAVAYNPSAEQVIRERQPRANRASRPRKPKVPKEILSPEEEQSTLKSIGKTAIGGLAAIGNVLDTFTGASSVRDVLTGQNPFDQFLSPFSGENKASGRDVLTKLGVTKANDPNKWELADFGGFAAEIALDPATWIGVGLLGKGAKAAGALKTYSKGARIAGKAIASATPRAIAGPVGKLVKPVGELASAAGRHATALFDSSVMGGITKAEQSAGRKLFAAGGKGIARAGQTSASSLKAFFEAKGVTREQFRRMVEGFDQVPIDMQRAIDPVRKHFADLHSRRAAIGQKSNQLLDQFISQYWPRSLTASIHDANVAAGGKVVKLDPGQIARKDVFRDIEQGTDTIERLARETVGMDKVQALAHIQTNFGALISDTATVTNKKLAKKLGIKPGDTAAGRHKRLARYMAKLSDETKKTGLFGNHPIFDAETALRASEESTSMGEKLIDILADDDALAVANSTSTSGKLVPLPAIFKGAGFNTNDAIAALAARRGVGIDDIKAMTLPSDYAKFLQGSVKGISGPKAARGAVKALDQFNTAFKMGVLTWPATITRNVLSGLHRSIVAGMFSPGAYADSIRMVKGGTVKHWEKYARQQWVVDAVGPRPLNAQTVTDALRERVYAESLVGQYQGAYGAVSAPRGTVDELLQGVPGGFGGTHPFSHIATMRKAAFLEPGTSFNPLEIHGLGGRTETKFGPALAANDANHFAESMNRIGPWLKEIADGADPTQAAVKVTAAQVDYSNRALSTFERDVMTRAMPFYKFLKGNTPWVLRQLWENPAGPLAQTIRAQRLATTGELGLPEYVSAQNPVALGDNRYLTGLGLMHEDVGGFFSNGVAGAGLELLSRTNPIVKGIGELSTGRSFFQRGATGGRDLADLDPTLGRTISNITGSDEPINTRSLDFLIGNSPLARVASTARTLTDPRKSIGTKALNTLTGLRVTDVSPEARHYALSEQVKAALKASGARSFDQVYFREGMELSVEQQNLESLMKVVQSRGRKLAKDKAAKAESAK